MGDNDHNFQRKWKFWREMFFSSFQQMMMDDDVFTLETRQPISWDAPWKLASWRRPLKRERHHPETKVSQNVKIWNLWQFCERYLAKFLMLWPNIHCQPSGHTGPPPKKTLWNYLLCPENYNLMHGTSTKFEILMVPSYSHVNSALGSVTLLAISTLT